MRTLCKKCLDSDMEKCVLCVAIIGKAECSECGIEIENNNIYPVKDRNVMAQYYYDLTMAKALCRNAVKEMIKNRVDPLPVFIFQYKNIQLMVPENEALDPVQVIGELFQS